MLTWIPLLPRASCKWQSRHLEPVLSSSIPDSLLIGEPSPAWPSAAHLPALSVYSWHLGLQLLHVPRPLLWQLLTQHALDNKKNEYINYTIHFAIFYLIQIAQICFYNTVERRLNHLHQSLSKRSLQFSVSLDGNQLTFWYIVGL